MFVKELSCIIFFSCTNLKTCFFSWGKYYLVCVWKDVKRKRSRIRFEVVLSSCSLLTNVPVVVVILPIAMGIRTKNFYFSCETLGVGFLGLGYTWKLC